MITNILFSQLFWLVQEKKVDKSKKISASKIDKLQDESLRMAELQELNNQLTAQLSDYKVKLSYSEEKLLKTQQEVQILQENALNIDKIRHQEKDRYDNELENLEKLLKQATDRTKSLETELNAKSLKSQLGEIRSMKVSI